MKTNSVCIFLLFIIISINSFGQFNRRRETTKSDTLNSVTQIKTDSSRKTSLAEFPGGMHGFYKYLNKKSKYPKEVKRSNIRGTVVVSFTVDTLGYIKKESVRIQQSLHEALDSEVVRLIKNSPRWIPGVDPKTKKKVETVIFRFPVIFMFTEK